MKVAKTMFHQASQEFENKLPIHLNALASTQIESSIEEQSVEPRK